MELAVKGVSEADASMLVQELELSLLRSGVPASAVALKRSSPENMDFGSLLSIDLEMVLEALGAARYIVRLAHCIFELVTKHRVSIRITTQDGTIDIPPDHADVETIKTALTQLRAKGAGS
jgi:hypothetical protein